MLTELQRSFRRIETLGAKSEVEIRLHYKHTTAQSSKLCEEIFIYFIEEMFLSIVHLEFFWQKLDLFFVNFCFLGSLHTLKFAPISSSFSAFLKNGFFYFYQN